MTASEPKELAVQNRTPMEMIQVAFEAAINQGGALEVIDRILEQQKWMIQHDEEERFNAALQRIQRDMQSIPKSGWNPDTQSKFPTAEDIDKGLRQFIDREGMTLNFEPGDSASPDEVMIVGVLALGAYSRRYPLPMPADGKGPKGGGVMSRTHATGSAITYGKRYLKNLIFDLRFKEKDDDGNAAGLTVAQNNLVSDISKAASMDDLEAMFKSAFRIAFDKGDQPAQKAYIAAKNKRKAELQNEPTDY